MNTKLATSCLLAGALLLPMAAYSGDSAQTDPGYFAPKVIADHEQTDPGYIEPTVVADHGQTDPGYIAPQPMSTYAADSSTGQSSPKALVDSHVASAGSKAKL